MAKDVNGGDVKIDGGPLSGTSTNGNIILGGTRGNVGIGTTAPSDVFEVVKNQDSGTLMKVTNSTTGTGAYAGLKLQNDGGTTGIGTLNLDSSTHATLPNRLALSSGTNVAGLDLRANDASGDIRMYTVGSERLRLDNIGRLGIGTTAPDEYLVVNNGSSIGKYTSSGWTHSSDRRLKHSITPLDDSLSKILKLQGVNYVFNNDVKNKNQIGFIAQDVETVYPEVVVTDENGFKSMIYANLVAPIVESIKSLYQSFKALESEQIETQYEMDLLKAENAIIKNENKKIWDELERIKLENEVLREKTEKSEKETADFKTRLERMERILQSH